MTLWVVEAGIGNTPTYSLISEGFGVKPGRMFTAIWKLGMIAVNKLLQLGCLNDFTVVDPESCATPQEIRRLTVVRWQTYCTTGTNMRSMHVGRF